MGKYPALSTVSAVARMVGWLTLVIAAFLALLSVLSFLKGSSAIAYGFILIIGAVVIALTGLMLVVAGESIKVFIDIEANTSEATRLLSGISVPTSAQTWSSSSITGSERPGGSLDVKSDEVQEVISLARQRGYDVTIEGNRRITFKSPGGGAVSMVHDMIQLRKFRKISHLDDLNS